MLSILLAIVLVVGLLYLLVGPRVAGGRYAATNPVAKVQLWLGVVARVPALAASLLSGR